MKLTIATIPLALATGEATEFTYTPVYKEVVEPGEFAQQEKEISRVASDFSFTPPTTPVPRHELSH